MKEEGRASSVRLTRSEVGISRPVSSSIFFAVAPAKVPESSSIPAGNSAMESVPAGMRG